MAGIACEVVDDAGDLVGEQQAAHLGEVERHQVDRDQLGEEGLGGGDRDLGPGVGVEHRVGLARDGRAVDVGDGEDPRALLRACRRAISVSSVSPLWLIAMTSVCRSRIGSR